MRVNESTAVSTSKVLLVPYKASHVMTYHEWMKDEEIQKATASEPLSLEEEYEMQRSWRQDHDKLTFIICEPLSHEEVAELSEIEGGVQDGPTRMIGDVNLYLSVDSANDDEENKDNGNVCIGELELMIAPTSKRRQGYGRAAITAFLHYISMHMEDIRLEFLRRNANASQHNSTEACWGHESAHDMEIRLMVKIDEKNHPSIKLFETLGFVKKEEKANFFGEFELLLPGPVSEEWTRSLLKDNGMEYREMAYVHSKVEESEPAAQR